jgi:hypothetical protein
MAVNYNPRSVTDGLVLHIDPSNPRSYPGNGTTIFDMSGNGNNGTLTNMNVPACYVRTYGGRALDFDGVNDFVNLGTSTKIGQAGDKTLSVWAFLKELNRFQAIVSCWSSDTASFELFVNNSSSLIGGGFYNGSPWVVTATASTNIWQHWAVTQSGSNYGLYRNGVLVSTATDGSRTGTTTATAILGQRQGGFLFNGQLDDIRLYNRALSLAEIRQNYNATRGRFGV